MWVDKEIYDKDIKDKVIKRIAGKVDVQLGKRGITEGFINELKTRLKKEKVVKIRVLRSFRKTSQIDILDIAKILARKTGSRIYEIRGFTIILIRDTKGNSVRHES
ncbi:MAG: YhbY family RNA-binding protein [Desulfurococcaceae archaeon]